MCTCIYAWNWVYVRVCQPMAACWAQLKRGQLPGLPWQQKQDTLRIQCFRATRHFNRLHRWLSHGRWRFSLRHSLNSETSVRVWRQVKSLIPRYTSAITQYNVSDTQVLSSLLRVALRMIPARGSVFKPQINIQAWGEGEKKCWPTLTKKPGVLSVNIIVGNHRAHIYPYGIQILALVYKETIPLSRRVFCMSVDANKAQEIQILLW